MASTALIKKVGTALYGRSWQSDIARELGVADRTVRRWAAGTTEPSPGVWIDLGRLCQKRGRTLLDLADRLGTP